MTGPTPGAQTGEPRSASPGPRGNRALAALAALCPLGFALLGCGGLLLSDPARLLAVSGPLAALLPLAMAAAAMGGSVLLYLVATGRRVPTALVLLLAILPALVGTALAAIAAYRGAAAIAYASPDQVAALTAASVSEALVAHVAGFTVAAPMLVAVALGLALAAGALPAGADDTRRRRGGLLAAIPVTLTMGIGALAEAIASWQIGRAFGALAYADPGSRAELAQVALAEVGPVQAVATWAWAPGLLLSAIVAVWAVSRSRPGAGGIIGAGAVLILVGITVGMQVMARPGLPTDLYDSVSPAWLDGSVELPRTEATMRPPVTTEVVIAPGRIEVDGAPVAAVGPALVERAEVLRAIAMRNPSRPFDGSVLVTADRRSSFAELLSVIASAQSAGFDAACLHVVGAGGSLSCIPVATATAPDPGTLGLVISIRADGLGIRGSGGTLGPGCQELGDAAQASVAPRDGRHDLAALARCMDRVRAESSQENRATVEAPVEATWDEVAPVAAVAQQRFSELALAIAR